MYTLVLPALHKISSFIFHLYAAQPLHVINDFILQKNCFLCFFFAFSMDCMNTLFSFFLFSVLDELTNSDGQWPPKYVTFEVNKASIYHLRASELVGGNSQFLLKMINSLQFTPWLNRSYFTLLAF